MKAPNFNLPDQNGTMHSLSDYQGKWIILYFYPKDDTPGCVKEACSFRDVSRELIKRGVYIIGVSTDTPESHKKFADKYKLNFSLLSDPTHKTIKSYGAWGTKKFMGKEFEGIKRNTYLINDKGAIVKTYENVNPLFHAGQIVKDVSKVTETTR